MARQGIAMKGGMQPFPPTGRKAAIGRALDFLRTRGAQDSRVDELIRTAGDLKLVAELLADFAEDK